MDYFHEDDSAGDIFWPGHPMPVKQSAFVKYIDKPIHEFPRRFALTNGGSSNMNKRVMEFLKRIPVVMRTDDHSGRERGRRHMISERIRREKQKNSYLALHSIVPPRTKNDKNSIVQVAAKEVEEWKRLKEEVERKNYELERKVLDQGRKRAKIRLSVAYPSSGIHSMLGVLKCLKDKGSITRGIHSQFSTQEFSSSIDIETKIEVAEVEEAVNKALYEVERESLLHYPQGKDC